MRAGVFLAYRPWFSPDEQVALATQADAAGLDSMWPLKLLARPVQRPIPIYLGAVGPRAVEQTSEIAGGWLPFMVDPRRADALLAPLDRGLARSGRTRADIDIAAAVDRLAAFEAVGVSTPVAVPCGDRPGAVRALVQGTVAA